MKRNLVFKNKYLDIISLIHECGYCGGNSSTLVLEHCLPESKGGKTILENTTMSCSRCNSKKRDGTLEDFYIFCDRKKREHLEKIEYYKSKIKNHENEVGYYDRIQNSLTLDNFYLSQKKMEVANG